MGKIDWVFTKNVYLGAQMESDTHLGHVSTYYEPYKLIGKEIKAIRNSPTEKSSC